MRAKGFSELSLAVFILAALVMTAVFSHRAPAQDTPNQKELTFNKDVAPVIFNNCAACHHSGGSAPFNLLSYSDVMRHAQQIAQATASRYMPPWLPEPGYGSFADERRLGDEQIRTIQRWVARGMQEGAAADLPPLPKFSDGWQLGKPDLIVQVPQPYILLAGANTESWPRFVLPIPATGTRYVKGIEIHPGDPKVVHHCYIVTDRSDVIHIANGEVYETGSTGMENKFAGAGAELDSRFLTWRPGTPPYFEPDGATWLLDKDTDLTLTLHLLASGKSETIQPTVGFYFSDKPPTKFPMILRLEHDGGIDIPPNVKDYIVSDDLELPVDVKILSVLPHAHYLCKEMQAFATLPDGTRRWLIWIKRWNFDWQGVFRYTEPIFLPKGTILSMRYTYDNSAANLRNPNSPPKRVVGGPLSTDEMADLWLEALPNRREDLYALEIALMQRRLAKYPHDLDGYADLGAALRAMGRNQEAVDPLREAARIKPDDVQVQNNLGAVLGSLGNLDEAIPHFREALRIRPDYFVACLNLANALRLHGDLREATDYYREAIRLKPESIDARNRLGMVYAQQGDLADAITQFQDVLRMQPNNAAARESLMRAQEAVRNVP
jgi:Flp pilus assembly protein TadD/mono/diheme cytochrome c family protein